MQTKKQQIENCRQVLLMLATIPSRNFELETWRQDNSSQPPDCRSVACIGGWLPWWPHFAELGVVSSDLGAPKLRNMSKDHHLAVELFDDEYAFANAGHHVADGRSGSDRAVAIRRFQAILRKLEAA